MIDSMKDSLDDLRKRFNFTDKNDINIPVTTAHKTMKFTYRK